MPSWDAVLSHGLSFILGVITILTAKPLISKIRRVDRSTKVNQSGARAGGDIVGRDKNG